MSIDGRCSKCGHVWEIARLPMPLEQAAKLMERARCPQCSSGKIYVA